MVMPSFLHCKERSAFTMIELVFAIVIIGIVAITIPTVLITNARHVENNLLQEAVLIAATKMGQQLSFPWDENSQNPLVGTLASTEVLDVTNGALTLDRNNSSFRIGHFEQPLRRRMTPQNFPRVASPVLGNDAFELDNAGDDLDDVVNIPITANGSTSYKQDYNISSTVIYISDNAPDYTQNSITFDYPTTAALAGTTNIKMITIQVDATNTPVTNDIVFRAYSCNIGETDYYKRTY